MPAVPAVAGALDLQPGQPVVGLDFDGVLNIVPRSALPPGFALHVVELDRANWPRHPYIRPLPPGDEPVPHGIVVNPAHGAMVRAWLAAGAAVVWATTWERAVLRNAALCDLPALPVLELSRVLPVEALPTRTADWKVQALQTAFPGHPLAWVDDFGADRRGESTHGDPPAPWLVVAPDETVGLTAGEADTVLAFVQRHRLA
ncbi:MAG: hypothetical protein MUD13_09040 [Candidatus Nanopelagicales bacterium]|jgi:hypothetical protein|nr:hypothetical protein [Candidatus Nanopelagicales bacterium]